MDSNLELVDDKPRALKEIPAATGSTPGDLLVHAMNSGATMDQLERLMALKERYDANEARKAYVQDMAQFKLTPPEIIKDKLVGYKNKDGSFTGYKHATLGAVTQAVTAGLAQHGFSHRWDTNQDGNMITVTCIITHRLGHSESISMTARPDDSGKKNSIQQHASAITYLQRYTLMASAGVAAMDQDDDDGAAVGAAVDEKEPEKHPIHGPAFDKALMSIRGGKYTAEEMRGYYALTPDQNIALADLLAELAK